MGEFPINETATSFYRQKVDEGRAVLSWREGREGQENGKRVPHIWLTKPLESREVYCLCFSNRIGLRMVDGTMSLASLALIAAKLDEEERPKDRIDRRKFGNTRGRRWHRRTFPINREVRVVVENRTPWLEPEVPAPGSAHSLDKLTIAKLNVMDELGAEGD